MSRVAIYELAFALEAEVRRLRKELSKKEQEQFALEHSLNDALASVKAHIEESQRYLVQRNAFLEAANELVATQFPDHKEWYCAKKDPCAWCRIRNVIKDVK